MEPFLLSPKRALCKNSRGGVGGGVGWGVEGGREDGVGGEWGEEGQDGVGGGR